MNHSIKKKEPNIVFVILESWSADNIGMLTRLHPISKLEKMALTDSIQTAGHPTRDIIDIFIFPRILLQLVKK